METWVQLHSVAAQVHSRVKSIRLLDDLSLVDHCDMTHNDIRGTYKGYVMYSKQYYNRSVLCNSCNVVLTTDAPWSSSEPSLIFCLQGRNRNRIHPFSSISYALIVE